METDQFDKLVRLEERSRALGFAAMGVTPSVQPLFLKEFQTWIGTGMHGQMAWLEKHAGLREHPSHVLKGCKTLISLAYPYCAGTPLTPDGFSASRYTEGRNRDYHNRVRILGKGLAQLVDRLYPGTTSRVCVDSAPLMERSFAYASGVGFIGKNTSLIIPGYGSYVYLVEVLTTAALPVHTQRAMQSECGSCTRCVDACPTGALERPYVLNARACLSYLTIEHRGRLDTEARERMGNCFFGCDVCQEVCPFNEVTGENNDYPLPSTGKILSMTQEEFLSSFGHTAFARGGLETLKRNVRAVRKNSGSP